MTRILVAISALVIIILITFLPRWARSSQRVHEGRQTIEVWGWNVAAMSLDRLTGPFEKQHPDIDVVITRNGTNMQTRLMLSLAANTGAPDVTELQQHETPRFIQTKRMLDLTDRASKYQKDFPGSAWGNCVYEGKVYAIPWDVGPCGIFYKRSLLAKHGIDVEQIKTWDDYIDAGKQLLERSGGKSHMLSLYTPDLTP